MTGVVARGDYLKSNPDALRRFLGAYVESIRTINTIAPTRSKKP
jgi:ABC-type nitrate/sulfonate/bicarbonate transport system substrate-binding protein